MKGPDEVAPESSFDYKLWIDMIESALCSNEHVYVYEDRRMSQKSRLKSSKNTKSCPGSGVAVGANHIHGSYHGICCYLGM